MVRPFSLSLSLFIALYEVLTQRSVLSQPRFLCEFFLKTHGLRQTAEIGLYRFLVSVKHWYRRHSHVHLFARFCALLHSEPQQEQASTQQTQTSDTGSSSDGSILQTLVERPRASYLDRSFLRVFLHARHFTLRAPPSKSRSPPKQQQKTPQRKKPTEDAAHVVQVDGLRKWVSLDHAVSVLRWYLSFLPETAVIAFCREVEYSTAILQGGALTEINGNRLAVRAEMRKAMLLSAADSSSVAATETDNGGRRAARIVVDVHKLLLLLLHALEQRRVVMERELIALFATVRSRSLSFCLRLND
ncbi:hypothetical protein PINS_up010787 [Pythium insidiosum]|nr:hypothetical protein PINS_up010787 [Pythium insidiosum]